MNRRGLSRRQFLRGASGALALPLLGPLAWADDRAGGPPIRLLFVYAPNGKHMPDWTPAATGTDFDLPWILEPLAPHRDRLAIVSGLTLDNARAKGDGPGDHARAAAAFLTGSHPRKTGGADLRLGVSVDQVAASKLGRETRIPSLELGCEPSQLGGECDSGYSCAYSSNLSWRSETTPAAKETHPRRVFDRLFADPEAHLAPADRARRRRQRASVLDHVLGEARDLAGGLAPTDRRKLDEYMESVRETEVRLERARDERHEMAEGFEAPVGVPADYGEYVRLMADLVTLAFRTDSTRVATLLLGNEGSNRSYPDLGVRDGHHNISHHGRDPRKIEGIRKINRFHVEQLAHLAKRLRGVPEGDGTLLDHTIVVYGSGIADGDAHDHGNLPILVLGGADRGRGLHVRHPAETPLTNLYVSLLARAGVRVSSFGDSTGPLAGLAL